ncbi:MAG: ImmA/IrrE family metallo-endopeptidase [Alphaproteobacteria bacterium]|nr:MAG: ImmA/IrrE family metallo-endopeptidase [Alphaproteobacteria bacterium]
MSNPLQIRPVRTDADHAWAMEQIDAYWESGLGSPEGDFVAVLSQLVNEYEKNRFPIENPSPLSAIKFRMEQRGLRASDIASYLGGPNRTSEILNGKRQLTMSMVRALVKYLEIPADILVSYDQEVDNAATLAESLPLHEMSIKGWFQASPADPTSNPTAALQWKMDQAKAKANFAFLCRKTDHTRQNAKADPAAIKAWMLEAASRAHDALPSFSREAITDAFVLELVRLSRLPNFVSLAVAYLNQVGIHLVFVKHLANTYLDGACIAIPGRNPIIAMSLRYDRIDNFWFVLLHELFHIKHGDLEASPEGFIVDDLDVPTGNSLIEKAADHAAGETMLPERFLHQYGKLVSTQNVNDLARGHRVHPAIVAGRFRRHLRDYRKFARMIGQGEVRKQAPNWY